MGLVIAHPSELSELLHLGSVTWVITLKAGARDVSSIPLTYQGEAGISGFPFDYGVMPMVGCISAFPVHFDVGLFCHLMCRGHSASFQISLRGSNSVC